MAQRFVLYNYTRRELVKPPARLELNTESDLRAYASQLSSLTDEVIKVHEVLDREPTAVVYQRTPVGFLPRYAA